MGAGRHSEYCLTCTHFLRDYTMSQLVLLDRDTKVKNDSQGSPLRHRGTNYNVRKAETTLLLQRQSDLINNYIHKINILETLGLQFFNILYSCHSHRLYHTRDHFCMIYKIKEPYSYFANLCPGSKKKKNANLFSLHPEFEDTAFFPSNKPNKKL